MLLKYKICGLNKQFLILFSCLKKSTFLVVLFNQHHYASIILLNRKKEEVVTLVGCEGKKRNDKFSSDKILVFKTQSHIQLDVYSFFSSLFNIDLPTKPFDVPSISTAILYIQLIV